ncbi:BrxE family protein [Thiocystis violascens]|nr:BrxE family protein [Thiocystis violascens]
MNRDARTVTELRILIGYLGELAPAWWSSQFFSPNAAAFLSPIFARTLFHAQCQGVTAAAARLHDEHIGVGRIYHVFRLPESVEQAVAATLTDGGFESETRPHLSSREQALERLAMLSEQQNASEGPMALGALADDLTPQIKAMAGLYFDAFSKGLKTFPYLREV